MSMSLHELLCFLEDYGLDAQIYLVAPHKEGRGEEEVLWRQTGEPRQWGVRSRGADAPWVHRDAADLIPLLMGRGVDMARFSQEVVATALMYVAHVERMHQQARRIFGDETLARARADYETLDQKIQEAVLSCFAEAAAAEEEEAETQGEPVAYLPPRLRLVEAPEAD